MNKKQAVIIMSLLVLIVCAGILATKANTSLYVNNDDLDGGKSTISINNNKIKKSNYFAEAKLTRNASNDKTLETLKSIINDKNATKESKKTACQKYTNIAVDGHNEIKIEEALKGNGFKDAVCSIQNGKAKVIVQSSKKVNDEQCKKIQQVVLNVSQIRDIAIKTQQQ